MNPPAQQGSRWEESLPQKAIQYCIAPPPPEPPGGVGGGVRRCPKKGEQPPGPAQQVVQEVVGGGALRDSEQHSGRQRPKAKSTPISLRWGFGGWGEEWGGCTQ